MLLMSARVFEMSHDGAERISSSSSSSSPTSPRRNRKSRTSSSSSSSPSRGRKRSEKQLKGPPTHLSVVVLDSDDSGPEDGAQGTKPAHRCSTKTTKAITISTKRSSPRRSRSRRHRKTRMRSRSRHDSRARRRSMSKHCSKSRKRPRSERRSPFRPVWARGRGEQNREAPLPAYALAYIPQAAVDAFKIQAEVPRSESGLRLLGDLCHPDAWSYVLKDEVRRSFAGYRQNPFTQGQLTDFFRMVRTGTDWKRPRDMPRGTAWMVMKGCACSYRYGGHEVEPQEYPLWMLEVMQATMPFFGLSQAGDWPTSCNLNLYETGGSSVAWHADDESLFNGKFQDARILSLSLGVPRAFELRANLQNDSKAGSRMVLGDGDLCTMEGMTQKHYQHRVPSEHNVEGQRLNLTWRWVVRHALACPAAHNRIGISA